MRAGAIVGIIVVSLCNWGAPPAKADCGNDAFCTLHPFSGTEDGEFPEGGVISDSTDQLYGTAFGALSQGGPDKHCTKSCGNNYSFFGNQITSFHYFTAQGIDGAFPTGEMLAHLDGGGKADYFFGTTEYGPGVGCGGLGCGTAYSLSADGAAEQSYTFCRRLNCADGVFPHAGLVSENADGSGNLYGTTQFGGKGHGWLCGSSLGGCGTIYQLRFGGKNPTEQVLYSFCTGKKQCADGAVPISSVFRDSNGNLFGTTQFGGAYSRGTIFELAFPYGPDDYKVLHSFCSKKHCPDGSAPEVGVVADSAGALYGTTALGGVPCQSSKLGCGVVFKLLPDGQYDVLATFVGGQSDGAVPESPVLLDAAGNIYGTTSRGGLSCAGLLRGCGTLFVIPAGGTESPVYFFQGGLDGRHPLGALLLQDRYLYGVTHAGGDATCKCGTLFRLDTSAARAPLR